MYRSYRIAAGKFKGITSILFLLSIVFPNWVGADTITVNTVSDSLLGNCLTVSTCSIRRAVLDASSGDTITFDPALDGQTIYLSLGEIEVDKNLKINGDIDSDNEPDVCVDGGSASRIFSISSAGIVTLQGLIIQNGSVTYPENGGGIQILGGSIVTIKDSSILSNTATDTGVVFTGGGGIFLDSSICSLNNVTMRSNTCGTGNCHGGAVFNDNSILLVRNSLFEINIANYFGGAIHNTNDGILEVYSSTFKSNFANKGGGIHNYGNLKIGESTFYKNQTPSIQGAYGSGGVFTGYGKMEINNSTFSENSVGISFYEDAGGDEVTIRNCTIYNNIYAGLSITDASSPEGAHLINSLIANNGSYYNDCRIASGSLATNNHNFIGDGSCSPFLSGDPHLSPLKDNGGPTMTHALLSTSPAIDAGDTASISAILSTDQRGEGFPRIENGKVDIGAFERNYFPWPIFLPAILP